MLLRNKSSNIEHQNILRTVGLSDYRAFGLLCLRTIGPSDYWSFGLSGLRTIGPSDYRAFGLLGLRTIGPSGRHSIFVALLWTFSITSMSFFRYEFQIHPAYSRCGRTRALNSKQKVLKS